MISPPVATAPFRRSRRLALVTMKWSWDARRVMLRPLRGCANRRMNALITSTPAEIAGHSAVDVLVRRRRLLLEQSCGLHDLAGLAIAALRHPQAPPGHLDDVLALGIEAFDGDDRLA